MALSLHYSPGLKILDLVFSGNPWTVTSTVVPSVNYLSAAEPKHRRALNVLQSARWTILGFLNT